MENANDNVCNKQHQRDGREGDVVVLACDDHIWDCISLPVIGDFSSPCSRGGIWSSC